MRKHVALVARVRERWPDEDPDAMIRAGRVVVAGAVITNPAARVPASAALKLRRDKVPRGHFKLTAALEAFDVAVRSRTALDVGASTGGFTMALLNAGATRVYAVDVGHGQLLGGLRADPRVVNLERTNLAHLDRSLVPEPIGLITIDLSYLALAVAGPQLEQVDILAGADLVALVKPMFELGLPAPPSDPAVRVKAVEVAVAGLERCGWALEATIESPIRGNRGAVEHFAHLRRANLGLRTCGRSARPPPCDATTRPACRGN
ncbi:MAG: hypothetical protein FWC87_16355 [Acidimicrobiaceae bacterium]|nr:hypothetical protein [Acidimicrobiaceae bacterium]